MTGGYPGAVTRLSVVAAVLWAVVFAALLTVQGLGLAREGWPTLSDMLRAVTRNPVARWILFGFWIWVGWHLFVRGWRFLLREP